MNDNNIEQFADTYFENDTAFKSTFNEDTDKIAQSMRDGVINRSTITDNIDYENDKSENTMVKEIKDSNKSLIGQMSEGIMKSLFTTFFKDNTILENESNKASYYNPVNVMNELNGLNFDKLNLTTIPKTVNLKKLKRFINNNNFNKITETLDVKYTALEASTILNLDSLISDSRIIPEYICCNPNITSSKLITIDFELIQEQLLNQHLFYKAKALDNNLVLITQPYPYDRKTGKDIYNKLTRIQKLF